MTAQGGGGGTVSTEGWLPEQGAQAGGGVGCQAAAQSYWELCSQKSSSVLMTSDGRKRRAGVYRQCEARRGQ